jgi:hypothetical protein
VLDPLGRSLAMPEIREWTRDERHVLESAYFASWNTLLGPDGATQLRRRSRTRPLAVGFS